MRTKEFIITHEMAAQIVRSVAGTFVAEAPADGYREMDLCSLARKLSFMVDADVRWRALDEVVAKLAELGEVDRGTHEDLNITRSGTADNTPDVVQRIETEALDLIEFVLIQAGFRPHWELAA